MAEQYETCVPEMEYVVQFLRQLDAFDPKRLSWPKEGAKSVLTRDGVLFETRSADDYRRIAEKAPDGIIGCEVGRWQWETFLRVNSRLAQQRGWAWLSGSFESSYGWQVEKWRQWSGPNMEQAQSWSVPSWDNEFVFEGGENDPEILRLKASMPANRFMERHVGVPTPPEGLVYPEFQYITHVSDKARYQPGLPVEVWIDPGYAGAYVVLAVQQVGDTVNVVDEVYVQRMTHAEVITRCSRQTWWKDKAGHGVIDVAGRQHPGDDSAVEVWQSEAGVYLDSQRVTIQAGIDRVHNFLVYDAGRGRPGVLVAPECTGLIAELGAGKHPIEGMGPYVYKIDRMGGVVSELPLPMNNHAASALAYGLVNRYGYVRNVVGTSTNYREGSTGHEGHTGRANWRRRGASMSLEEAARSMREKAAGYEEPLVH